ncbi:hypothetical protein Q9295_15710 [Xinfangfangia sp. CPCC 101601]|uniref:Transposase DDE domain-containing protein n=1 Tax=Pseudogemmobacter lacusdianii TaxID=3069608 RepID=A0ABU0W1Q9_9RHOB|nr:hypothetical protein [Xinfangfangia sp. CPCC 101601]
MAPDPPLHVKSAQRLRRAKTEIMPPQRRFYGTSRRLQSRAIGAVLVFVATAQNMGKILLNLARIFGLRA